jgi:hypothetical protein
MAWAAAVAATLIGAATAAYSSDQSRKSMHEMQDRASERASALDAERKAADLATENAAKAEAEKLRKRKGMKSTILTGMDQTLMQPAQTQKAELLG